ncbi:MAG: hypothetical protein JWM95_3457, partial [Gemmatimonadetes bacterium]|nr:hypothetical protein [Gemmatimonadota bacterium]
ITLDHTGSLAGLTITSTGIAGSGGTISNKVAGSDGSATQASGIYLDNVVGVSLTRMQLNDFGNFAIRGTNVTGFSLTNSVISGTNGSTEFGGEGAIRFDGLFTSASFPTATITNSTIGGGYSENIRVKNGSGTLNRLIVDNVTLAALGDNATHGGDAFIFEGLSGATMNLTLSNSNINGARGDLLNAVGHGGATMDVVLRQNRFYNLDVNTVSGGGGVTLAGGDKGTAAFTFDVSCNRFKGTQGSSLNIFKSPSSTSGSVSGTVASNLIGVSGTAYSGGSSSSPALWIQSHGSGKVIALIQNNSIAEYGEEGIDIQSNQGSSAGIEAAVYGNTIFSPSALATSGVTVEAGVLSTDGGAINFALGGSAGGVKNTLSAGDPADVHDVLITKATSTTTSFLLYLNGLSNGTVASVIQAGNVGTTTVSVAAAFASSTTNTPPQSPASVSSCSTPTPLMADVSPVVERDVRSVTDADLAAVAAEAVSRVMRVSPLGDVQRFNDVSFAVTTLPERQLAEATARRILVSPTAAGWGWFVDATPGDDAEFEDVVNVLTGEHELRARRGSLAEGRMDLLTALIHELEHTLGARDLDPATARSDVMSATLPVGTRRSPRAASTSQGGSHE